jgi:hypothetical protein
LVQGALATAGKYSLNSWAVAKKGPSYPPMFSPLSVVFTVVLGSIFIGDDITVGRCVLRCCFFYFFSLSSYVFYLFFLINSITYAISQVLANLETS